MVLQDEDLEKQAEILSLLNRLTMTAQTEDQVVHEHIANVQKKYTDVLKETETIYKAKVRQTNASKARGPALSTSLYRIKQIAKRITIEGEHTCLVLLKHD